MDQQKNISNPILIAIVITAIIVGGGIYWWQDYIYDIERQELQQQVNNLQNQVLQLQQNNNDSQSNVDINKIDVDELFTDLPQELLQRDETIKLTPTPGFIITTSIISNKGDRIVYSEISDCIGLQNNYSPNSYSYISSGQNCNEWKYNIYVKDLVNNKVDRIYSYPEKVSFWDSINVKKAQAGGCQLVYFPFVWSKNDEKIILKWGNPTDCGSGGAPKYETFTINPNGGDVEGLATYDYRFYSDYSKVIYIDGSIKSPAECGPVSQLNSGKIVLKDIASENSTVLAEEPNSNYSLLSMNEGQNLLNYSITKVKEIDGCSSIDSSILVQQKQIVLP